MHASKKFLTHKPNQRSGKYPTKAKVLVVYRTGFIRSTVLSLIAKSMEFVVCGETDEAPLARELFLRQKPDLVLVGLRIHGADGVQLIKDFQGLNPAAAILAFFEDADACSAQHVFRAGARGYLSTEDAPELLRAFGEISAGHAYLGASALPLILCNFAADSDINSLSDRELEIFSFIGMGLSVSELASELHVSVETIRTHQMRIKEKFALHSSAELRQKASEWQARSAVNRELRQKVRKWLARPAVNRIREDPESE